MQETIEILEKHFNKPVHHDSETQYPDEFIIGESEYEVVTKEVAISNERENFRGHIGVKLEDYVTENAIGIYTRIPEADLYYREY